MKLSSPLVSVIIPTRNRASILTRAIDSVLSQSFVDYELIVISDGSTDNTENVVQNYQDNRIKYLAHSHAKGASAARNTGLRICQGQYIAFLDDDDEWLPGKLAKQVKAFEDSSETVGLIYTWMEYHLGNSKARRYEPRIRGNVFPQMLDRQAIGGCPTIMIRREVIQSVGYFDEKLLRGNDGDYWRRIAQKYDVDFVPEVLARVYTEHGYERITSGDRVGLMRAIQSQTAKLVKFRDYLKHEPGITALIKSKIACHYMTLGEWRFARNEVKDCIRLSPFNLTVYKNILVTLLFMLRQRVGARFG